MCDKKLKMDWVEFVFELKDEDSFKDILIARLSLLGFDSFDESGNKLKGYILNKNVTENFLEDLKILTSNKFKFSSLEDKNWNTLWESNFKPILIQDICFIRAPFHKKKDVEIDVLINPKMAFGTGHHETTRMMISEILNLNYLPKKVFDIGCGTGILSIISEKKWNCDVLACDIDEWSIKNSKENIILNNCNKIKLIHGSVSQVKMFKYELILANINTNVLLNELDLYYKFLELNGTLILSGFLVKDYIKIYNKASECGFTFVHKKEENKWNCIVLRKSI